MTDELASYGADKVYLIENEMLHDYNTDTFSAVMCALISKYKPSMVLYPSTYIGRDQSVFWFTFSINFQRVIMSH